METLLVSLLRVSTKENQRGRAGERQYTLDRISDHQEDYACQKAAEDYCNNEEQMRTVIHNVSPCKLQRPANHSLFLYYIPPTAESQGKDVHRCQTLQLL